MSRITVLILLAACYPAGALIGLVIRFGRMVARVRRINRIPRSPRLEPTQAEHIPPELASLLQAVAPALEQLGFAPAASVYAPEMAPLITWTQVLFVHRERGDRASVMWLRPTSGQKPFAAAVLPRLMFATELPDGRSVKTHAGQGNDVVADDYARHRAEVERQFGPDVRGVAPEPRRELPWLQERAEMVAAAFARGVGFVPVADGAYHAPPRRIVWAKASELLWRRPALRAGFDVLPRNDDRATSGAAVTEARDP